MYSSAENINHTIEQVNQILLEYGFADNAVLVLDSTHFTEIADRPDVYQIKLKVICDTNERYLNIMKQEAIDKAGYAVFDHEYVKLFSNLSENPLPDKICHQCPAKENVLRESVTNVFVSADWHNTLQENRFGGASFILAKKHGEAQSAVYLMLEKNVPGIASGEIDLLDKSSRKIVSESNTDCLEEIFSVLEKLLLDEMLHNIFDNYREQQSRADGLEKYRNHVLVHQHTFSQLDLRTPLANAESFIAVNDIAEASRSISRANKEYQIMRIVNACMFGNTVAKNPLTGKTITQILEFFNNTMAEGQVPVSFDFSGVKSKDFVPCSDDLLNYFTLLINLWVNGKKYYGGLNKGLHISADVADDRLQLIFSNSPAMSPDHQEFLNGNTDIYPPEELDGKDPKFKGLSIIKDLAAMLGTEICVTNVNDTTMITLTLTPTAYETEHAYPVGR